MNKHYDYLIVGAGLFGSVFSYEMRQKGKTCLVIDKRDHLAGNIYTREVRGIQVLSVCKGYENRLESRKYTGCVFPGKDVWR